ncbi:MAG: hypothetical protein HFJ33_01735 [Clostridia bacterium]|nr:hypothetical protein [Clostridia bacterium]
MTRRKISISLGIMITFMLLFTTKVNATESFSTSDGIVVNKIVEGINGDIELKLTNIPLKSDGGYEWAIATTKAKEEVSKWHGLNDFNEINQTAQINLLVSEKDILNILRTTNTAYLYIKDIKEDKFLIDALQLDLTLPPYHTFDLLEERGTYYFIGGNGSSVDKWKGAVYNIKNVYYKFVKVTDENIILKYNEAIDNKTSIEDIFNITENDIATLTDWQKCIAFTTSIPYTEIESERLPTDGGLYILYMKAKDTDSKTVYGYKTWPSGLKKVEIGNNTGTGNNENSEKPGNTGNSGGSGTQGGTLENGGKSNTIKNNDPTIAKQILPNTGIATMIIFVITMVGSIGIVFYIKYKKIPLK